MDIDKMLAELRMEREQIEEAILTLERLARGRGRRRGRPPAWLKGALLSDGSHDGHSTMSEEHEEVTVPAAARRRGRPPKSKPAEA